MKITKTELKRIIKENLQKILDEEQDDMSEGGKSSYLMSYFDDAYAEDSEYVARDGDYAILPPDKSGEYNVINVNDGSAHGHPTDDLNMAKQLLYSLAKDASRRQVREKSLKVSERKNKMKITKTKLEQIIKEEIDSLSHEDVLGTTEPKFRTGDESPEDKLVQAIHWGDEIVPQVQAMGATAEEVVAKLGVTDPVVVKMIENMMALKHEKERLAQQVRDYFEGRSDYYPYPE